MLESLEKSAPHLISDEELATKFCGRHDNMTSKVRSQIYLNLTSRTCSPFYFVTVVPTAKHLFLYFCITPQRRNTSTFPENQNTVCPYLAFKLNTKQEQPVRSSVRRIQIPNLLTGLEQTSFITPMRELSGHSAVVCTTLTK
jgi:hypothetical protein